MLPPIPDRLHAAQIEPLVAGRDWAGLLMYWFAHEYQSALEESLLLVKEGEESLSWQPYYRDIWRFLQVALECWNNPQSIPDEYPRALSECLDDPQIVAPDRSVLRLMSLWPAWRVCELPTEAPREDFERGVRAAEAALEVPLDETPEVRGRLLMVLTEGYADMNNVAMAEDCCKRALAVYEQLVPSQPDLYMPYVTELRRVQRTLGQVELVTGPRGLVAMFPGITRHTPTVAVMACFSAGVPFSDPRLYLIAGSSWYIGRCLTRYLDRPTP